eukprot:6182519-Pleurochrysis_carterae.AAC.9
MVMVPQEYGGLREHTKPAATAGTARGCAPSFDAPSGTHIQRRHTRPFGTSTQISMPWEQDETISL